MKIAITTPTIYPEQNTISNFVSALKQNEAKYNFEFSSFAFGKDLGQINSFQANIVDKRKNFIVKNFLFFKSLINKKSEFQVIFCQQALLSALPSLIFAKLFGKKVILNFLFDEVYERYLLLNRRTSLEEFYTMEKIPIYLNILKKVQRFCLKISDVILVPNLFLKEVVTGEYNISKNKIVTLYPFYDNKTELKLPFSTTKNQYQFLTFSSLSYKNLNRLKNIILTLAKLQKEYPEISFHVLGDGEAKNDLEKWIEEKSLQNLVITHGKVSQAEIEFLKKQSNFYFLLEPTARNIYHVLENFSFELITLLTENKLARECISNLKNGIYVDLENISSLEEQLDKLLKDVPLQKSIIKNSKENLSTNFSTDKYFSEFGRIIKENI